MYEYADYVDASTACRRHNVSYMQKIPGTLRVVNKRQYLYPERGRNLTSFTLSFKCSESLCSTMYQYLHPDPG